MSVVETSIEKKGYLTQCTFDFYHGLCTERDLTLRAGDRFMVLYKVLAWGEGDILRYEVESRLVTSTRGHCTTESIKHDEFTSLKLTFRAI